MNQKLRKISGWTVISITTIFASFWGFWGILENFHEGWYSISLYDNLLIMFGQYMLFTIIFVAFGIIGIFSGKAAAILSVIFGILFVLFFRFSGISILYISVPLLIIAILFWFTNFEKKRLPVLIEIGVPLLVIIGFAIEPVVRLSGRITDNYKGERLIKIETKSLIFAPEGIAWNDNGTSWYEADSICRHLCYDGKHIMKDSQNIWRLPTLEELVIFSHRNDKNCRGSLDNNNRASYAIMPDKEPPLWNSHSKIIYWWTSDSPTDSTAFRFAYNGTFLAVRKKSRWGYLSFRAVRDSLN